MFVLNDLDQPTGDIPHGIFLLQRHESPGTSAVFGRCGSGAADTDRISLFGVKRQFLLDPNLVLPSIDEVVLIEKAFIKTKPKAA